MTIYQFWSSEEKEKLQIAVKVHTNQNGRINWNAVSQEFESKTKQQCKSYYLNVLRSKKENKPSSTNESTDDHHQQQTMEQIKLIIDRKQLTPESQELRQIMFNYITCGLNTDEYFKRYNSGVFNAQIHSKIQKLQSMYEKAFGLVLFLISYPETDYKFDYGLLAQIYRCLEKMETENKDFQDRLSETCLRAPPDSFVHKMSDLYSQHNITALKDKIYWIFSDAFGRGTQNDQEK